MGASQKHESELFSASLFFIFHISIDIEIEDTNYILMMY